MFPNKNTNKDSSINRFRSIFAVKTDKIGAEMAKVTEKIVINNPACPRLTPKSVATLSKIPPIINSTIPTTNETIVNKYTRLSILLHLSKLLRHYDHPKNLDSQNVPQIVYKKRRGMGTVLSERFPKLGTTILPLYR